MEFKPSFDLHDLPQAYFSDNNNSDQLRKQVIKNQVKIPEAQQGMLEELFFSNENIDLINKQLILSVFKKTKGQYKIAEQSSNNLLIVMRYIFLEYARHLPYNITEQIRELNCTVVGELVPTIVTNVAQKLSYLKEISEPRKLIPLPINVNKNNKNLQAITSIF